MKVHRIPDYQAEVCASFAQGNVGKAIQLASSDEFHELKLSVIGIVKKIEDMDIYELNGIIKQISEYKNKMEDFFDLLILWYRDVLYFKSTENVTHLIFKDEVYDIKRQAAKKSYSGIDTILSSIEQTKRRLTANVNFDLSIELLLLTIQEN